MVRVSVTVTLALCVVFSLSVSVFADGLTRTPALATGSDPPPERFAPDAYERASPNSPRAGFLSRASRIQRDRELHLAETREIEARVAAARRLHSEMLFGVVGAVTSLFAGGLLLALISLELNPDHPVFIAAASLAGVLLPLVTSLSVSLGGVGDGGRGLFIVSFAGALIGAVFGLGAFISLFGATSNLELGAIVGTSVAMVGSVAGALIAYELSHDTRVRPLIALSPTQGLLGADFTF